jgi:phospholipid transport system substrate-binding protein
MRWSWGLMLAGTLALSTVACADDSSATAVVSRLNGALLDAMKQGAAAGYQGRFDRLAPVMRQVFNFDFMAEKSLGNSWSGLSTADQAGWRDLFSEFTIANYAANFDRFTGQQFQVVGEDASVNDSKLVKTKVITPGADPVDLTYRLQKGTGGWRIVDVYLNGTVSELALRRSDYASVLQRDGFDALATVVRGKIADLAAGRGKRERP